jgi:hypothetical protein
MNKEEQAAFVEAYCNNVANAPEHIVEAFVTDYENGEDMPYDEHYTSIMDALGMWHSAIRYQLQRTKDGKI